MAYISHVKVDNTTYDIKDRTVKNIQLQTENLNDIHPNDTTWYWSGGGNTCENKPNNVNSFGLLCLREATGYIRQIIFVTGSNIFFRVYNGATWTEWKQIATTDYVNDAFKANDAMVFKGTIGSSGASVTTLPTTHYQGWTYKVATAGNYVGQNCEAGDMIICITDGNAANDAHWTVVQTNMTYSNVAPSDLGSTASTGSSVMVARADHVHKKPNLGNITYEGKISATTQIDSGDKILISDFSDSNIIKNTSINFDGSSEDKALTPKGTWGDFYTEPEVDEKLDKKENLIIKNISGNIVHFEDAIEAPAVNVKVDIDPTQNLKGYDHPWYGGAGKNLVNPNLWHSVKSSTVTVEKNSVKIQTPGLENYEGANLGGGAYFTSGTYYIKFTINNDAILPGNINLGLRTSNTNEFKSSTIILSNAQTTYSAVFTITEQCYLSICQLNTTEHPAFNVTLSNLIISTVDVPFEPYENICPITGHTESKIFRTEKNLLPKPWFWNTFYQSRGITAFYDDDGIHLNGTATGTVYVYLNTYSADHLYDFNFPPGNYLLSANIPDTYGGASNTFHLQFSIYNTKGEIVRAGSSYSENTNNTPMVIHENETEAMYIYIPTGKNVDGYIIKPTLQLESETDSTYKPIDFEHSISFENAGIVYKGILDTNNKKLTVTHALWSTSQNLLTNSIGINGENTRFWLYPGLTYNTYGYPLICDSLYYTVYDSNSYSAGTITTRESYPRSLCVTLPTALVGTTSDSIDAFLQEHPFNVLLELATPQTYYLTSQQFTMLLGQNNNIVYSNTGNVSIDYFTKNKFPQYLLTKQNNNNLISDSIITFPNKDNVSINDLIVNIEPKQDLNKYNLYPPGGGRNLLPMTVENIKSYNNSNAWNNNKTIVNGITYEILVDINNNVIGIKASGTATATSIFWVGNVTIKPNTSYTLNSGVETESSSQNYFRISGPGKNSYTFTHVSRGQDTTFEKTSEVEAWGNIRIENGEQVNLTFKPYLFFTSNALTSYEPYSNVCSISGWTNTNIIQSNKNLFNKNQAVTGLVITDEGYIQDFFPSSILSDYIPIKNGICTFSAMSIVQDGNTDNQLRLGLYDANKKFIRRVLSGKANAGEYHVIKINDPLVKYVRCNIFTSSDDIDTVQVELNNERTEFEINNNNNVCSIIFPPTDGMIYGGSLNITTGILTIDRKIIDIGDISWYYHTATQKPLFYGDIADGKIGVANTLKCSCYNTFTNSTITGQGLSNYDYGYIGISSSAENSGIFRILITDDQYTSVSDFVAARTGQKIIYSLASPITYQLAPQQITELIGSNIWSNTGDISLNYFENENIKKCIDNTVKQINRKILNIESTISGSNISFDDGTLSPVKNMIINIGPMQDGSGNPAPDNVRPFLGKTGINITYSGKNLFNIDEFFDNCALIGTSLVKRLAYVGKPNTDYICSTNIPNQAASCSVFFWSGNASAITPTSGNSGVRAEHSRIVTSNPNGYISIGIYNVGDARVSPTKEDLKNGKYWISINELNTSPINWQSKAEVVYGGNFNVLSGTLTITHTIWSTNSMRDADPTGITTPQDNLTEFWVVAGNNQTFSGNIKCDSLIEGPRLTRNSYRTVQQYSSSICITMDTSAVGTTKESIRGYLSSHPITFWVKLATPIIIQIVPTKIMTNFGYNFFSTDVGPIEMTYQADTKQYIIKTSAQSNIITQNMITQSSETELTATKNYEIGDLLIVNNQLLRVTQPITAETNFNIGSSGKVEIIDLATIISELNQRIRALES